MPTDTPNVIVLTVDALRADRMGLHGYARPTTPALDRLAENAIVCDNAFSLGPFTQSACVQMFTSSRPLSYGGYDAGAKGRPSTLFKRFHDCGYRTSAFSTLHWVNRYFGYGDGLDTELQLFTLNTLVGVAIATMRNSLIGYHQGKIPRRDMLDVVRPVISKLLRNADEYCDLRIETAAAYRADFPDSLLVNAGYDYRKIKQVIARHREEFEADAVSYVHRHLHRIPEGHEWMARDWHYLRPWSKLLREGASRMSNRLIGPFNPRLAEARNHRFKSYVDAAALADKVISVVEDREAGKPFFIWTHFMDTHRPYVSGRGREWYKHTPGYLEALGYSRDLAPARTFRKEKPKTAEEWAALSALYDAAVRSTDEAIGRIIDAVDRLGLGENTLIVVSGDHGEELGEHGDLGHNFSFYEHNARVPMLFRIGKGKGQRIDSLVTSLDLAPTIASLAGIDPAPGWEGEPVTAPAVAERTHIVMETFFGGNCIFEHRPLYMGVRTKRYKYMWKEFRDPRDRFSPDGHELYDLDADPGERNNLFRPDHPVVMDLNPVIVARLREIPEISPARIDAAFAPAPPQPVAAG